MGRGREPGPGGVAASLCAPRPTSLKGLGVDSAMPTPARGDWAPGQVRGEPTEGEVGLKRTQGPQDTKGCTPANFGVLNAVRANVKCESSPPSPG